MGSQQFGSRIKIATFPQQSRLSDSKPIAVRRLYGDGIEIGEWASSLKASVPNAISAARIAISFLLTILGSQLSVNRYMFSVCLVGVAIVSDILDGHLARRWGVATEVGYVLDAIGDRAMHLALLLMFFQRYTLPVALLWLIVFRDIGIYCVRILSKDWFRKSIGLRWVSLLYAFLLRLWFVTFVVRDGFRVFRGRDVLGTDEFELAQMVVVASAIGVAYYGLYRSLNWLKPSDMK
jgi:phosphatidylglycerophosphate synthase